MDPGCVGTCLRESLEAWYDRISSLEVQVGLSLTRFLVGASRQVMLLPVVCCGRSTTMVKWYSRQEVST